MAHTWDRSQSGPSRLDNSHNLGILTQIVSVSKPPERHGTEVCLQNKKVGRFCLHNKKVGRVSKF